MERSSFSVDVKSGGLDESSLNKKLDVRYSRMSFTDADSLPEESRYSIVISSGGKKPQVAPYSGAMFAIVALSGRLSPPNPEPKNSTNLPTTPCSLNISTIVRAMSVAVTPGLKDPVSSMPTTSGKSMYIGWPNITASASIPPTPQPRTPRPFIMVV